MVSAFNSVGLYSSDVRDYGVAERQSRHNWAYWQRRAYGGIGPSAHEFDGHRRRWNIAAFAEWESQVGHGNSPSAGSEALTREQAMAEEVYLSLRTAAGMRLSTGDVAHVSPWIEAGWATLDANSVLRLTAVGWLRLDALASDLTLFRSRY